MAIGGILLLGIIRLEQACYTTHVVEWNVYRDDPVPRSTQGSAAVHPSAFARFSRLGYRLTANAPTPYHALYDSQL